jgi:hypothetical protein
MFSFIIFNNLVEYKKNYFNIIYYSIIAYCLIRKSLSILFNNLNIMSNLIDKSGIFLYNHLKLYLKEISD